MYVVTLNNSGGELDRRQAATPEEVAKVAVEMIESVGVLYDGDHLTIKGEDGGRG